VFASRRSVKESRAVILSPRCWLQRSPSCRSGGIGRRAGFKIRSTLALTACSEDNTLGHFDVDQSIPEIHVKGSAVSALLPSEFSPIPLNIKSEEGFQNENFDYLTTIEFDQLTLTIAEKSNDPDIDTLEDGTPDNFDFFGSVAIYIRATIDGVDRREIIAEIPADSEQLTSGQSTIDFTMSGVDILSFVESPTGYEIITEATGVPPNDDVYFEGDAVYRVGIGFR